MGSLGCKRLNIPLKIGCESLQAYRDIETAAQKLNYSQGYIFNALKVNELKLNDVIKGNGP